MNSILDNELTNIRPIRATTTLNGLVTKAETDYETFQYSCNTGCPGIATRFNPTETREYDYASGAPGPLLRRTARTFTM